MKIPDFIMLKSVCHNIVLVKGGRPNADEGWRRGEVGVSQKVTKDDEGGGVSGNPQNWLTLYVNSPSPQVPTGDHKYLQAPRALTSQACRDKCVQVPKVGRGTRMKDSPIS